MPFNIDDDDEYVARLLSEDAKKTTKTYALVGLDAFNPKRSRTGAPKPNTKFLRHIIRQTDSHNAALLAKEAAESSSRLRRMNRGMDKQRTEAVDRAKRRIEGRLSPPPKNTDSQNRRSERMHDTEEDKDDRRSQRRRRSHDDRSSPQSRWHRDRGRDRHRDKRRHEDGDEERTLHRPKRSRDHERDRHRGRYNSDTGDRRSRDGHRRRRRFYSRSPSRSRSGSPRCKSHRKHDRTPSPQRRSRSPQISEKNELRQQSPASDSDPLDAAVGPLPPPPEPNIRSRGRGTLKGNSYGIESRFSTHYDPPMDVSIGSDTEDVWGEALEAMRDRERWKQQGAERLRAAGFKDEQVQKWQSGGDPVEEEVVWTKKGQSREWDRGKVVDDEGDVALVAEWGRLK